MPLFGHARPKWIMYSTLNVMLVSYVLATGEGFQHPVYNRISALMLVLFMIIPVPLFFGWLTTLHIATTLVDAEVAHPASSWVLSQLVSFLACSSHARAAVLPRGAAASPRGVLRHGPDLDSAHANPVHLPSPVDCSASPRPCAHRCG